MLIAYVNHNRWVVDCPCGNGIIVVPRTDVAVCPDAPMGCGQRYPVQWPAAQSLAAAQKALEQRPIPYRNWFPDRETVADLRAENTLRGVE